jgi:hypothetical protein
MEGDTMVFYHGGKKKRISRILRSGFSLEDQYGSPHGELVGIPFVYTYQWFVKPRKPTEFGWQVLEVTLDLMDSDLRETTEYDGFWPEANIYWLPIELVLRANPGVRPVSPELLGSPLQLQEYKNWKKLRDNPSRYQSSRYQ